MKFRIWHYAICNGLSFGRLTWQGVYESMCVVKVIKGQVQDYCLVSNLKTYHPTLHFTSWSLDLFIRVPFQFHGYHTVLQPFWRIEHIVHIFTWVKWSIWELLSALSKDTTMSQDWEGKTRIFFWKYCTKRDLKPHGRQRYWQSSVLSIAPRSSLIIYVNDSHGN